MARFDIDDICSVLHQAGFYTAQDPVNPGGLILIKYGPQRKELQRGTIGKQQLDFYGQTSGDLQEVAQRVIDHAVNGVRSDLSSREITMMAEQKALFDAMFAAMEARNQEQHKNTIEVFTKELARLTEALGAKAAPVQEPPVPQPEEPVTPEEATAAITAEDILDMDPGVDLSQVTNPLDKPLYTLDLPPRALKQLIEYPTIGDLVKKSKAELGRFLSTNYVNKIVKGLANFGLELAPNKDLVRTPSKVRRRKIAGKAQGGLDEVRKHNKEDVLRWAAELGEGWEPQDFWFDAKGRLLGHIVARVVMGYARKFGRHPSGNIPTNPDAQTTEQKKVLAQRAAGLPEDDLQGAPFELDVLS